MSVNRELLMLWGALRVFLFALPLGCLDVRTHAAAPNLILWDTGSRLGQAIDLKDRAEWTAVPTDITALESDPAKAASDPGYYGRAYTFHGDAVVENASLTAVFVGDQGKVLLFSRPLALGPERNDPDPLPSRRVAEMLFTQNNKPATRLKEYHVRRNANDDLILDITASVPSSREVMVRLSFGRSGIVSVKPAADADGVRLVSPLEYGVAPAFIGDDLVVSAADVEDGKPLWVPADNMFLGLIQGERQMLVMTWPAGNQTLQLGFGSKPEENTVDFQNLGKSVFITVLDTPGIWHKEPVASSYLEKDVSSQWKRPFRAGWKTILTEAGVKTTFGFRETKGQIWRGVPGSYIYPVWFDGDRAVYHLSKKVPPDSESLVYFLESDGTPLSIPTPADILRATLGLDAAESILDLAGRHLRTHHRRAGAGVHRACTCGCTEAIQAIFEAGQEVAQREFVDGAVRDMMFFVEQHVARIDEYQQFARDLLLFLNEHGNAPGRKEYIQNVSEIAQQILEDFEAQKENMKTPGHAQELATKTMRLTEKKDQRNLENFMQLLKDWRAMGGAQDYVVAQCHVLARRLFQESNRAALGDASLLPLAKDIRARCRQILRNPDGYEIWANY